MKRQSGVLLPVFSLPGPYGCGTFGKNAFHFIDRLKEGGFSIWQVLPFGIVDEHYSPYMSFSSFAGNPYFIDPDILFEQGLITEEELIDQEVVYPYLCRYEEIDSKRMNLLKKAASRFSDVTAVQNFMKENPLVAGSCRFLALKEKNGGRRWQEWTESEPDGETLFAWQFIEYEFHREWKRVRDYASECGIKILGDLPFYVSQDSYDVWSSPDQFLLDERNNPTHVAGVPPDYFAENGQLWGNPIYDWDKMEKDGYKWWKDRMNYVLTMFDGIRVDHFRAFSAFWKIPADSPTAKTGKWVEGPGRKIIDAFREFESRNKFILAEDLGIIDDSTRELLEYSGYPGMAVIQFGFGDSPKSPHLPHNYKKNLIAYTGTHDNNTLLGFLQNSNDGIRNEIADYYGYPSNVHEAVIRSVMMSSADTVILPLQDILGFGADTRINTPGVPDGNWRYRVTADQLNSADMRKFRHFNTIYGRI